METKIINNEKQFPSIIIGKLMNISGILQREGNRLLLPYQLNQQQFSILFEIAKAEEIQQKNMVNRLLLEKAHVSKAVKKLQNMGLIEITPKPDDKRSTLLSITKKGQNLVDQCREMFQKWNSEWFKKFSPEELRQILESVDKLQHIFIGNYSK
ncbi:MAG: winged helix-turn-helix transcriptional regulator [Prolixibacteraceae bacterium]|nr:winged helix-turn-helix transcriptional regulator [Prolixibacteraceae bacterium]